MLREFIFPSMDHATKFTKHVDTVRAQASSNGDVLPPFPIHLFDNIASMHRGQPFFTSLRQREIRSYNYQSWIHPFDRYYLHQRDPTARMIVRKPAMDSWSMPPKTFNPAIDRFLARNWIQFRFGLNAMAADVWQGKDGGSFLYIIASGKAETPLPSNGKIAGYRFIREADLHPQEPVLLNEDVSNDPLTLQHGIREIRTRMTHPVTGKPLPNGERQIHGSRIMHFKQDFETDDWKGAGRIDPWFDDLWNLRDVIYGRSRAQIEGNPIIVSVKEDYENSLEDPDIDALDSDLKKFQKSPTDTFAPVEGFEIKRLGATDLDDVQDTLRILATRMAHDNEFTAAHFLMASRGSEQVTDAERMDYISDLRANRCRTFNLPLIMQLIDIGKALGAIPRRSDFDLDKLRWPNLRELNERERAFVDKSDVTTIQMAARTGHAFPEYISEKFPRNEQPYDPRLILPTQPKSGEAETPEDEDEDEEERTRRIVDDVFDEREML